MSAQRYRRRGTETEQDSAAVPVESQNSLREDVLEREQRNFGGIKVGSAFFGWVAAMGIAVLLTALVAATGAAIGQKASGNLGKAVNDNASAIGLWGAVVLAVIMFIAYYCGGYVAGRMARFNGALQGLTVWLWAVVIAIIIAILTAVAGSQYDILSNINGFPRIPMSAADLTTAGIVTAIVIALVSLGGALLGGIAGMRYHRHVDRAGLGR
ncbi:hypothetical protein GCM10027052_03670 [Parafrigoribacterium mesophilum]|uniref:hypothetical protein n=1 Tax=Parafrigoribacterium mesophilum TaxID=433646 RepID=UPI0031FCA2E3